MRGKDCSESSRLGDKYSDDSFNELKHANQWRIQKETSNTNLYLDENGNENKENINYDTNVKGLVNDIETNIASKKGTSRASSIPKNRPSKSSSKSAAQPSSRPLRSSSADPRNKRGLSGIKLAEQPTKSDSPQRAKRGSRDEWLATSDELQQMLIQGTTFLIKMIENTCIINYDTIRIHSCRFVRMQIFSICNLKNQS